MGIARHLKIPFTEAIGLQECTFCPENPHGFMYKGEKEHSQCSNCNAYRCPNRGCSGYFNAPQGHSHTGMSCANFLILLNEGEDAVNQILLSKYRECPDCRMKTDRIDGCNHIKCAKCSAHWCYACGFMGDKSLPDKEQKEATYAHMRAVGGCGVYPPVPQNPDPEQ